MHKIVSKKIAMPIIGNLIIINETLNNHVKNEGGRVQLSARVRWTVQGLTQGRGMDGVAIARPTHLSLARLYTIL